MAAEWCCGLFFNIAAQNFDVEWDGEWKHERTWLFVDVRTMRVICSVKVKRKEDEGVTGVAFFSSLIAWSFWERSLGVAQNMAAILRQSNSISICQYIFAISQRYSSVILDSRTGDPRPSRSTILGEWSRVESKRLTEEIKEEALGRGIARCFIHQSWWWLIRCLISASGWHVQRGPLRTSGSAGSGVRI